MSKNEKLEKLEQLETLVNDLGLRTANHVFEDSGEKNYYKFVMKNEIITIDGVRYVATK